MDIHEVGQYNEHLDTLIELSDKYAKARTLATKNKFHLDDILSANLSKIRQAKSNVGYDMAILMLLEPDFVDNTKEIRSYYENMLRYTAEYKGLEKRIEAINTKISWSQSYMKWIKENT